MTPIATNPTTQNTITETPTPIANRVHAKATNTIHYTVYYGTFVHTPHLNQLEINFNTILGVNEDGVIDFIQKNYNPSDHDNKSPIQFFMDTHHPGNNRDNHHRHFEYIDYSNDLTKFYIPGFIDTHVHASQFPNCGIGLGTPLLDWLTTYTFPLENQFRGTSQDELKFAIDVYTKVINRTLENGTTCGSYFTTIDPATSKLFAELLLMKGQRGFVGKVCMDHNQPYEAYQESLEDCVESMNGIIEHVSEINPDGEELVIPIITPRFAPVCSREMLKYLGKLSVEKGLPIQTHISENKDEVELVKNLFPDCDNYASVYDKHNLLNSNTILAHAVHLTHKERKLIKEKNCSISHCPTSNTFISSGEAPVYTYLHDDKINVSLGTDVSGGFDCSILQIIKHSILVSHHLSMKPESNKEEDNYRISMADGLYMATMGGAIAVGLQDSIGSFEIGKKFDTQLIDLKSHDSKVDVFDWQLPAEKGDREEKMKDLLGKWIFTGDDRNCVKVWCNGRLIVNKERSNHRDDRWVIN
ncbi:putative guanine deaminase [Candida viswanathii]|uniref:Probable guanine deaminase n=1 Tax=Candida viswanathii TaxID=5486 RepID=A0A367YK18_9ASCO|nr:putative guanine deaminase [Candida viswanathii]